MNSDYTEIPLIKKKLRVVIEVPAQFSADDARNMNLDLSTVLKKWGCRLLEAQPHQDLKNSLEFILDDELCVQDEHFVCVDGYLCATDSLVARMQASIRGYISAEAMKTIENPNFYVYYNLKNGTVELPGSYWYMDAGKEKQGEFTLQLTSEESISLIDALESYCENRYHMSCLNFVNEARSHEGLPILDFARKPLPETTRESLNNQIQVALSKLDVPKKGNSDMNTHMDTRVHEAIL